MKSEYQSGSYHAVLGLYTAPTNRYRNLSEHGDFNLPMHLFLSPLDKDLINHVTHGMVIKSLATQQLSPFEVRRWQQELNSPNEQIRQLAIDEIGLMLKRFSLSGWEPILVNKTSRTHKTASRAMRNFMSARCWALLPKTMIRR